MCNQLKRNGGGSGVVVTMRSAPTTAHHSLAFERNLDYYKCGEGLLEDLEKVLQQGGIDINFANRRSRPSPN